MITFLILIAPLLTFILYAVIRIRLERRKQPATDRRQQAPQQKPYEPAGPQPSNAFLRRFPLTTQLYLRQQWSVTRFGFIASFWIFTVLLCQSLVPPFTSELPIANQRVWLSFVMGASVWGIGSTAIVASFAAGIACTGIVASSATYIRSRPISLHVLFWGRILPALTALLLAATLSVGVAFGALRFAYGPVWNSVPTRVTSVKTHSNSSTNRTEDERTAPAATNSLRWLAQNPTPRILASAVSTMMLCFAASVLLICQPFGANNKSSPSKLIWIMPITICAATFAFNVLRRSPSMGPSLRYLSRLLFYNVPLQAPPPWRFLPVPLLLSIAFLILSERLYLRRDI